MEGFHLILERDDSSPPCKYENVWYNIPHSGENLRGGNG
jgi:hypothetical protein